MEAWYAALGTIVVVIGVTLTMCGKAERKVSETKQVLFKRFDEYKKHMEETHVSKEVCGILHKQICEDIVEIKADVKKLLLMAKNGTK